MIVATFTETSGCAGRTITYEDGRLVIEGRGPVTAGEVLDLDARGHLDWVDDDLRSWVASAAVAGYSAPVPLAESPARMFTSRGRRTGIGALAVALLIGAFVVVRLLALGASLSGPDDTAPKQGVTTHTSEAGGYRISYPARFERVTGTPGEADPDRSVGFAEPTPEGDTATAGESSPAVAVLVFPMRRAVTPAQNVRAVKRLLAGLADDPRNDPEMKEWDREVVRIDLDTLGGQRCVVDEYTYRSEQGVRVHSLSHAFFKGTNLYVVQLVAPEDVWQEALPEFERVIGSFTLL